MKLILWILILMHGTVASNTKEHPCRPNPCFNGGRCFRVSNNARNFQCRCRPDYVGERCESMDTTMSAAGVLCADTGEAATGMEFTCPISTTITVEYAAYGLPSNESLIACRLPTASFRPCVYDRSLTDVMNVCHGLTQCALPPLSQLFPRVGHFCKANEEGNFAMEYRMRCRFADEVESSQTTSAATTDSPSPTAITQAHFSLTSSSWCQGETEYFENGFCYRVYYAEDRSKRKSWNDAREHCISQGGELVGPVTRELHEKLAEKMKMFDERKIKYFWIGARTVPSSEGDSGAVARWVAGGELTYIPDDSKLDEGECIAYYVQPGRADSSGRAVWLAKSCSLYYNWICQMTADAERTDTATNASVLDSTATYTTSTPLELVTTEPVTHRTRLPIRGRTRPRPTRRPHTTTAAIQESSSPELPTEPAVTIEATSEEAVTSRAKVDSLLSTAIVAATTAETSSLAPEVGADLIGEDIAVSTESNPRHHQDPTDLDDGQARQGGLFPEIVMVGTSTVRIFEIQTSSSAPLGDVVNEVQGWPSSPVTTSETSPQIVPEAEMDPVTTAVPTTDLPIEADLETTVQRTVETTSGEVTVITATYSTPSVTEPYTTSNHKNNILGSGTCEATTQRGVDWPATREGDTTEKDCPKGIEGKARWECRRVSGNVRFFPAHPDLSGCQQMWFQELHKQAQHAPNSLTIVQDLFHYLTFASHKLYGGDIKQTLLLMEKLVDSQSARLWGDTAVVGGQERFTGAVKFAQALYSVIDFWMSTENIGAWQDLPLHSRMVSISALMNLVEATADFLSRFMPTNNTTRFNFTNFAIRIEVLERVPIESGQLVATTQWHRQMGPPINSGYEELNREPNLDAVSAQLPDLSMRNEWAQINLPSAGILGAQEGHRSAPRSIDGDASFPADSSSGFAADRVLGNTMGENRLRLAYFVYTGTLNKLLQPSRVDAIEREEAGNKRVTLVNSVVIGATVNDPNRRVRLPEGHNVTVTLRHLRVGQNGENPRCVYWKLEQNSWDTEGCEVVNSTAVSTTCTCNHLTSFAILMDVTGDTEEQALLHRTILKYLTMTGCGLSAACLILSVLVFTFLRSMWSVRNCVHRNLCICLLIGELVFLLGVDETGNREACTVIAILLHYFFLAAFSWMFMEGYQLYAMLVRVFQPPEMSQLIGYYVAAYGAPAIVVAVSVGLGKHHYGTNGYCWINANSPIVWAFVGPIALVVLANMIFLAIALKVACGVNTAENRSKVAKIKGWLKGSTVLLSLLGLTWVFGFLFVIRPAVLYFAYIFTLMNSLQGVFIFTFHVLLNEKVHVVIRKWFKKRSLHLWPNYYAVNTRSRGSSNEINSTLSSRLPNRMTASTSAINYGFPKATSSFNPTTVQPREMMENPLRNISCRKRTSDQSRAHEAASEEAERKQTKPAVQIVHRALDDRRGADPRCVHQHVIPAASAPLTRANVSPYVNGQRNGMLQVSVATEQVSDQHCEEPGRNRFYYTTNTVLLPHLNGKSYQQPVAQCTAQKFVERF